MIHEGKHGSGTWLTICVRFQICAVQIHAVDATPSDVAIDVTRARV